MPWPPTPPPPLCPRRTPRMTQASGRARRTPPRDRSATRRRGAVLYLGLEWERRPLEMSELGLDFPFLTRLVRPSTHANGCTSVVTSRRATAPSDHTATTPGRSRPGRALVRRLSLRPGRAVRLDHPGNLPAGPPWFPGPSAGPFNPPSPTLTPAPSPRPAALGLVRTRQRQARVVPGAQSSCPTVSPSSPAAAILELPGTAAPAPDGSPPRRMTHVAPVPVSRADVPGRRFHPGPAPRASVPAALQLLESRRCLIEPSTLGDTEAIQSETLKMS